jgi:SAM-dependent methyltransferase
MSKSRWNALADTFESDVLQIASSDTQGSFLKTARRLGNRNSTAIDFGCGIGSSTRLIAPFFGQTLGIDFSPELVSRAISETDAANVRYMCGDLTKSRKLRIQANVAFLINVLIQDKRNVREAILKTAIRNTVPGGKLVIIVPSLESMLHVYQVLLTSNVEAGKSFKAARSKIDRLMQQEIASLADGLVSVGGVVTKHYMAQELELIAHAHGLSVSTLEKVRYPWDEEADNSEQLEAYPEPWDWILVVERN